MNQKNLARWLKCIFAIVGVGGLLVYTVVIPLYGVQLRAAYPEFSHRFLPWLLFLWISGVPCFVVLGFAWKMATNIGQDQSFSLQNVRLLKWTSVLAAADAGFFFVGNVLLFLLNMSHPSVALLSLGVLFVGIAVPVVAAVLSHLVQKGAVLQEQSDWTI